MKTTKRILVSALMLVLALTMVACQGGSDTLKVGMVTDAGTIDDKSFNQGTWEGVIAGAEANDLEYKYNKPSGTTPADYLAEITNLYDAGYKLIVTPGFKFETTIFEAQTKYEDAKFVLIDGYPHAGDWVPVVNENVVSIFFAEEEAGFLAGVAAALQLQEGEFGFIGGMEIPAVQKFNWGFQQGLAYANENHGTVVSIAAENVIYEGTFDNVAGGQQLAAGMFDKGVDAIFCAAGGVGAGAISEAKTRAAAGEEVWIVGVDVDQYAEGIYEGENSVILTSAVKYLHKATSDMIQTVVDDEFPGTEILTFSVSNDGVGIPTENPNLDAEVESAVADIYDAIGDGSLDVSNEQGNLIP